MTYPGDFQYRPRAADHRPAPPPGSFGNPQEGAAGFFPGDGPAAGRDVQHESQQASHRLLGPLFDRMHERQQRRQQFRRERVEQGQEQQGASRRMSGDSQPAKIERTGGIQSLDIPMGFGNRAENNDERRHTITYRGPANTTINYSERKDFKILDSADSQILGRMMQAAPHALTGEEVPVVNWMTVPGLWGSGNFDVNWRTQELAGKKVITGDLRFRDSDRQVRIMFFNPDEKNKKVEALWIDGPAREVARYDNLFSSVRWANPAPAPKR